LSWSEAAKANHWLAATPHSHSIFTPELKDTEDSLFFSPYSVSICLAMTYAGARGETEIQMAWVLHFTQRQAIHNLLEQLQHDLNAVQKANSIELNVANALWAQKGHPFTPAFLNVATQQYGAMLKQADFKDPSNRLDAVLNINHWVAEKTKDRIQNIISSEDLDELVRLILVNAIYFKGTWAKPFETNATTIQPFHVTPKQDVQAPLMHHLDSVNYKENSEFQAVEFPYRGGAISMVILLPRQINGFKQLEGSLNPANLALWLAKMQKRDVEMYIPRFTLESRFSLAAQLAKMGMANAFSRRGDFSGMDGTKNLFISAILHKAWVEVDEHGTEAAATTAAVMKEKAELQAPPPPVFRAITRSFSSFAKHVQEACCFWVGS
jgi:serpin B